MRTIKLMGSLVVAATLAISVSAGVIDYNYTPSGGGGITTLGFVDTGGTTNSVTIPADTITSGTVVTGGTVTNIFENNANGFVTNLVVSLVNNSVDLSQVYYSTSGNTALTIVSNRVLTAKSIAYSIVNTVGATTLVLNVIDFPTRGTYTTNITISAGGNSGTILVFGSEVFQMLVKGTLAETSVGQIVTNIFTTACTSNSIGYGLTGTYADSQLMGTIPPVILTTELTQGQWYTNLPSKVRLTTTLILGSAAPSVGSTNTAALWINQEGVVGTTYDTADVQTLQSSTNNIRGTVNFDALLLPGAVYTLTNLSGTVTSTTNCTQRVIN